MGHEQGSKHNLNAGENDPTNPSPLPSRTAPELGRRPGVRVEFDGAVQRVERRRALFPAACAAAAATQVLRRPSAAGSA